MTEGPNLPEIVSFVISITYKSPHPACIKEIVIGDWKLVPAWFRNDKKL